jgi:uroporphyrinogen decarboxylase
MKQETLTSRERVIRTLNREPVDRFPIDLGSHMSTGISAFAYWNLRKYLELSVDDIWIPDCVQLLAYVDEDIRTRFHLDCILLEPRWKITMRWQPREKYQFHIPAAMNPYQSGYGDWIVRRGSDEMCMPGGGYFFDGAWLQYWGTGNEDADLTLYAREAERIYKETPYATNFVGYGYGGGFGAFFGDIDRLVRMLDNPDAVIQENEVRCEEYIKRAGKIIDSMGKYIQLLSMSDDMGMQHGPMCKPSIVEQCVAPFIKKFCEFIHRNSDIKVFMHNCGSIKPLIPILIDCGIDVLNPVQISAANMNPQDLKQEFGDNIIFWGGGCNTQNILGTATPEMVAENVRELIRIFKVGGGFVFNQVHNIMGDVPPESIFAMLDTAYEESFYGQAENEQAE